MKRMSFTFDLSDPYEAQAYELLQNVTQGKRAAALSHYILNGLAASSIQISGNVQFASKVFEAYALMQCGSPPSAGQAAAASPVQVMERKRSNKKQTQKKLQDIAPVETPRVAQQVAEPAVTEQEPVLSSTVQEQETVEIQQPVATSSQPPVNSEYLDPLAQGVPQSDDGFSYLDEKKYLSAQITVAKDYVLNTADLSSRQHLAWQYDESRDEDLYDELLPYPSRFNDHPEMYPEGYDNLLNYVTDQLEAKKIRKKVD